MVIQFLPHEHRNAMVRLARASAVFALLSCFTDGIAGPLRADPPPGERIVKISVLGSSRYPEAEIIRATGLKLGADVRPETFQNAAISLAATGAFSGVNYKYSSNSGGVAVEFRVADGGDFGACNFDNLIWFSEKELRAQLRDRVPLFAEQVPLKGETLEKIKAAIALLLKGRGVSGTVTYTAAGEIGGPVRALQFNVVGVRLGIQQIRCSGARAVDSAALAAAVEPLLNTDYDGLFVREFAEQNAGPLFWRLGYLKVTFAAPRPEILGGAGASQNLAVTIPVEEGDQYLLRELAWTGNSVFSASELAGKVHVLPSQPADTVQLGKDLEEIQRLYGLRGYITAAVISRTAFDDAAKSVVFEIDVREGDLYKMGKLEIAGVDSTRAEALKNFCELAPGQPYNRSYWSEFISKSGRLLPAHPAGWKAIPSETINPDSKTVDVTLTFAPNTGESPPSPK